MLKFNNCITHVCGATRIQCLRCPNLQLQEQSQGHSQQSTPGCMHSVRTSTDVLKYNLDAKAHLAQASAAWESISGKR